MRNTRVAVAGALALLVWTSPAGAESFKVDPAHTSVLFHVNHLFTEVTGRFREFEGTIELDASNPKDTKVEATVQAASIDTNNEKRDKHLRSNDFFAAEEHPVLSFKSTAVTDVDEKAKTAKMAGLLTIRGVQKQVVFDVKYLGQGKDPWGNARAGFHGETTINRKDFGLNWNEVLEAGGLLVGEQVRIEIKAEGILEPERTTLP